MTEIEKHPNQTTDQPEDQAEQNEAQAEQSLDSHTKADSIEPEPITEPDVSVPPETQSASPRQMSGKLILFVMAAIVVVAFLGFVIKQLLGQNHRQEQAITSLRDEVNELRQSRQLEQTERGAMRARLATIENTVITVDSAYQDIGEQWQNALARHSQLSAQLERATLQHSEFVESQQGQLKGFQEQLAGQQKKLRSLSTASQEDWLLAEAEYLLKLANQRILLEKTPANALALLGQVDQIIHRAIQSIGDQPLFAIRDALAKDIALLKEIPTIDTEGIYLQLGALAKRIHAMPLQAEPRMTHTSGEVETQNEDKMQGAWNHIKQSISDFIDQSFKVYPKGEAPKMAIKPHTLQLMQLNIQLALEQAQLALIKGEQDLFRQSLRQALGLLNDYPLDSQVKRAAVQAVNAQLDLKISLTMPDISGSLKQLQEFTEQQGKG